MESLLSFILKVFKKDVKGMMCSKKALVGTGRHRLVPLGAAGHPGWVLTWVLTRVLNPVLTPVLTRVAAGCSWAFLGAVVHCWTPLGAAGHICANFATCNWEPLTMLSPQFVAGEHGLFGAISPKTFGHFVYFDL